MRIQIDWARGAVGQADVLYASRDLARAWSYIRDTLPPDALVLAEDALLGAQTPAFTLRRVWYGQMNETPNWKEKRDLLIKLLADLPVEEARALLAREEITAILNVNPKYSARWQEILDRQSWQAVSFGTVTVYQRVGR